LIYIPYSDTASEEFWSQLMPITDIVEKASLIAFTGGEDIDPTIYGERNISSFINKWRDEEESRIFELAMKLRIPCTGICRGAQLITALCGGRIIQDIHRGHKSLIHGMITDVEKLDVSSCHHQMCVPNGGEVIAVSTDVVYKKQLPLLLDTDNVKRKGNNVHVTEAIFYNLNSSIGRNAPCFGVQFHPEWSLGYSYTEMADWTLSKVKELLLT